MLEHIARHYADNREHLLRLLQQAHQGEDYAARAGYGRNIERTDGRILRYAGTTSRTLFRQFRARQGSLSGDDADLFPGRQSDNDTGKSLQRFLHHHGLHRLYLRNSRSLPRQPDRLLGIQAPQRFPAQIHHLYLYRNQRTNLPSRGVTLCQAHINSRTLQKDRVINKHFMLKDKV